MSQSAGKSGALALALALTGAAAIGGAGGCAFESHRRELEAMHAAGRYDVAARTLDDQRTQGLYQSKDRLLYLLDRGSVALALDDAGGAMANFEAAESVMERQQGPSTADTIISWTLNDAATTYVGDPYESIYVNVFKLLAQLEYGQIQGGATVEARRAAGKADVLRGRYMAEARKADGERPGNAGGGPFDDRHAGEFIESPLGIYLTAVTFMKTGDTEHQRVAGRRLVSAVEAAGSLVGPVDPGAFASLGELPAGSANVLVVALSGRGPTKFPQRIGPIPIYTWPVYFELPVLQWQPSEVASVRIIATPVSAAGGSEFQTPLSLVENLAMVATENHKRALPLIYTRTLIRSSAKAGASFAITEAIRRNNRNNDAALIAGVLGGLAAVVLTERADLRCWTFLPGQAHVGLINLEPGEWEIRTDYLSASGGVVYQTPARRLTASSNPADLTTLVEHYWR